MPFSSFPLYQHTLEGKVTAVDTQLPVHRNAFHKEKNETSNIHTSKFCDPRLYSKEEIKQNKNQHTWFECARSSLLSHLSQLEKSPLNNPWSMQQV